MELIKADVVNNESEDGHEVTVVFSYEGKTYCLGAVLYGDDESFMVSLSEKRADGMFYEKDWMLIPMD